MLFGFHVEDCHVDIFQKQCQNIMSFNAMLDAPFLHLLHYCKVEVDSHNLFGDTYAYLRSLAIVESPPPIYVIPPQRIGNCECTPQLPSTLSIPTDCDIHRTALLMAQLENYSAQNLPYLARGSVLLLLSSPL